MTFPAAECCVRERGQTTHTAIAATKRSDSATPGVNQALMRGCGRICGASACSASPGFLGLEHRCDETIAPPRDGLDEAGLLRIVPQDLPDLANRAVDAVVAIEVDALSPNPLDDLLPADQLSPLLRQEQQHLHGDSLQLERVAGAAQLVRA